jgi:hypothetical protein
MSSRIAGSSWPFGVEHDDDVGTIAERLDVAGLLVGAVARVVWMRDHDQVQRQRERRGPIQAAVVDEGDSVDDTRWNPHEGCSSVLAAL